MLTQAMQTLISRTLLAAALISFGLACIGTQASTPLRHGWWRGLGPVLPHDDFPADCSVCHVGAGWHELRDDFSFDHERETGVALVGAHEAAQCLLCHNDRGPVDVFQAQGCAGCHEDIHVGQLGTSCLDCHNQETWYPSGMLEMHRHSRFPLTGVHQVTACRRCHPGAEVGRFTPTDTECVTCHVSDLQRTTNPNHIGLGWIDRCDRCHQPTSWNQAEFNPSNLTRPEPPLKPWDQKSR